MTTSLIGAGQTNRLTEGQSESSKGSVLLNEIGRKRKKNIRIEDIKKEICIEIIFVSFFASWILNALWTMVTLQKNSNLSSISAEETKNMLKYL